MTEPKDPGGLMRTRLRSLLVIALICGAAAPQAAARAAPAIGHTYQVNSTLDQVDADPGDGLCASAAGPCTLRAAVMESNLGTGLNTILVPAGTYTLTRTGN